MKLDREQILKALECCIDEKDRCGDCPCEHSANKLCVDFMAENALSLIRELTAKTEVQETVIAELRKLLDKANHDADRYARKIKELTEENERLKQLNKDLFEDVARLSVDSLTIGADTVRKMQDMLTTFFRNDETLEYSEVNADYINEQIDRIAKELLEGDQ